MAKRSPDRPAADVSAARAMARRVCTRYAVRAPEDVDIEAIAMAERVLVIDGPLSGADARMVRGRSLALVRVRADIPEEGRRRLAIAHEMGHWLLHGDATQLPLLCDMDDGRAVDDVDLAEYRASNMEVEATSFASELLMPMDLFEPLCPGGGALSLEDVKMLARRFRTTLTATTVRAVHCRPQCFVAFTMRDGVTWWKRCEKTGAPAFLWLTRKQPLDPRSMAWRCHEHEEETPREEVPLDAWFPHIAFKRPVRLVEQAMRLGTYGTVMSLLTVLPV